MLSKIEIETTPEMVKTVYDKLEKNISKQERIQVQSGRAQQPCHGFTRENAPFAVEKVGK